MMNDDDVKIDIQLTRHELCLLHSSVHAKIENLAYLIAEYGESSYCYYEDSLNEMDKLTDLSKILIKGFKRETKE